MKIISIRGLFILMVATCMAIAMSFGCGGGRLTYQAPTEAPPATPPLVLGTPLGLMATASNHQVALNWEPVSSAESYVLYYATSPGIAKAQGSSTKVVGTPIEGIVETSFAHTGLDNGKLACYVVEALAADGTSSGLSTEVCATPMPGTGEASITPYSMQNTITWDMMPGDVDSWNIYRSVGATPSISVGKAAAIDTGVMSPYVDTGLSNNNVPVCYTLEQVVGDVAVPYSEVCGTPYTVGVLEFTTGDEQRTWSWASDVELSADGAILVLAVRQNASSWDDMMVMRFLGDTLDTSFGVDGYYYSPINDVSWMGNSYSAQKKIGFAIDDSGNIDLAVTWLDKLGGDVWYPVRRLLSDGSLDRDFGSDGLGSYTIYGAFWHVWAHDLVIDEDANILLAGNHTTNLSVGLYALWRYLDTGFLDTFFECRNEREACNPENPADIFGVFSGAVPNHDQDLMDIAIDSQERVVAGGIGNAYDMGNHLYGMIWRHVLVDDGKGEITVELDDAFAKGAGWISVMDEDSHVDSIIIDDEGRIVFAGASPNDVGGTDFVIGRLTADGVLDETFGDEGYVRFAAEPLTNDYAADVVVDASGKIVAVGTQNDAAVVHRYLADGTLDPTFASDGIMTIEGGNGFDAANRLAIDDMGRLVVVGQTQGDLQLGVALWRIQ